MKITLLVSAMNHGGAERVAATLVNAWAERGDDVTLFATFSKRRSCVYPLLPTVRVVYLADIVGQRGRSLATYWRRFWALRRTIEQAQPDVLVSFLTNVNVAVLLASRGLGIPVVVCERVNPAAENESSSWLRLLRRLTYRYADAVAVQAEEIAAAMRTVCPGIRRISVVPNPLPTEILSYKHSPSGARRRLLAMGRLTAQKRFDELISVFAALAPKHTTWDLWIWGEGPLRTRLERMTRELGLVGRVYIPGLTTEPWRELAQADAFVLASAFEGFPNALLEAMAIGVPSVALDCPSGPSVLTRNGKDGILVPLGDRTLLRSELDRIFGDASLRAEIGRRGANAVRDRFALKKVLGQWDEVFQTVRAE